MTIVEWANAEATIHALALTSWLDQTGSLICLCPLTFIIHVFREHNTMADSLSCDGLGSVAGRLYYEILEGNIIFRGFWNLFTV